MSKRPAVDSMSNKKPTRFLIVEPVLLPVGNGWQVRSAFRMWLDRLNRDGDLDREHRDDGYPSSVYATGGRYWTKQGDMQWSMQGQ